MILATRQYIQTNKYRRKKPNKQDSQCTYDVTLRCFIDLLSQAEKQQNYIFRGYVCSLGIQRVMRLCGIVICDLLGSTTVFTLFNKRHNFRRKYYST
jgi:hypothetical protein